MHLLSPLAALHHVAASASFPPQSTSLCCTATWPMLMPQLLLVHCYLLIIFPFICVTAITTCSATSTVNFIFLLQSLDCIAYHCSTHCTAPQHCCYWCTWTTIATSWLLSLHSLAAVICQGRFTIWHYAMVLANLHCCSLLLFPHWFVPQLQTVLCHCLAILHILATIICHGCTPQWHQWWHVTFFLKNFSYCLLQLLSLLAGVPPIMIPYPLSLLADCCSLHFFFCHLLWPLSLLATVHCVVINADATLAPLLQNVANAAACTMLPLVNLSLLAALCHCVAADANTIATVTACWLSLSYKISPFICCSHSCTLCCTIMCWCCLNSCFLLSMTFIVTVARMLQWWPQ